MTARVILIVLSTIAIVGCGGDGISMNEIANSGIDRGGNSGIDRGGITRGRISGFGSVLVNGVRWDTSNATITLDERPGIEDDLQVGQVVTVRGTVNSETGTATAETVSYDAAIEGPVDRIDERGGRLHLLGQTVVVTAATRFSDAIVPSSLEGVSIEDAIEVSGFSAADGAVVATYVGVSDRDDFEISGVVAALDPGAMTFEINGQRVRFTGATLEDFPGGQIAQGQYVEVQGSGIDAIGEFVATEIEFHEANVGGEAGDEIELEGVVTRLAGLGDFDVGGQQITTDAGTEYDNGTGADLAASLVVEIEGQLGDDGVLKARRVVFQPEPVIRIAAPAEAVDSDAGTVVVLATAFRVNERTSLEDDSDNARRSFDLDDIVVGDYLEVRGFSSADSVVAASIQRDDAESDVQIRGFVATAQENEIGILGVRIQTTAETEIFGPDGERLTEAELQVIVQPGMYAQARGVVIGDALVVASELSLSDTDD